MLLDVRFTARGTRRGLQLENLLKGHLSGHVLSIEPVWPSCVLLVLCKLARVKNLKFIYFFKCENENE